MTPERLRAFSAAVLPAVLYFGILTVWAPGRWALGVYQAAALLLAAVWMGSAAARGFRPGTAWAAAPVAFAVLVGLAQLWAGTTVSRGETWNAVLDWTTRGALFFVAAETFRDRAARRRFLNGALYFGFGLSAVSTVQMFTSGGKIFWLFPSGYTDLVLGPFVYKNQYAAFIETVLAIALYRAVTERRGQFRYRAMAAVMVASVIAGASRMGSVLVVAEVVAIPALAAMRGAIPWRGAAVALGQFVALAAIATAVVGQDFLWQRFQQADPYVVRREMVQSSVQMVRERPWTGFGLGTWSTAYPAYALYDDGLFANQAHNDWAQWAVEGGVPLLAAMALFGLLLARPAVRSLWGLGVMAVLVHCVVDYPMQQRPALAGWIFALAGVLAATGGRRDTGDRRRETGDGRESAAMGG